MVKRQKDLYKGHHVTTSSSGGSSPPFTASYGVAEDLPNGTTGPVISRQCKGASQMEDEAHAVAAEAARKFIDSKLRKK